MYNSIALSLIIIFFQSAIDCAEMTQDHYQDYSFRQKYFRKPDWQDDQGDHEHVTDVETVNKKLCGATNNEIESSAKSDDNVCRNIKTNEQFRTEKDDTAVFMSTPSDVRQDQKGGSKNMNTDCDKEEGPNMESKH